MLFLFDIRPTTPSASGHSALYITACPLPISVLRSVQPLSRTLSNLVVMPVQL